MTLHHIESGSATPAYPTISVGVTEGAEYTLATQGVNNSGTFAGAASGVEWDLLAQNVDTYFMPSASSQTVIDDIESMVISASVSRSLSDKMFTASFKFDKTTISAIPANYFTHVVFKVPDYLGVSNVVFCGFFPSSQSSYKPANFKDTFSAVDYGFYLTKQYLSDDLLALKTPTFQSTDYRQVLLYDYCDDPLLNFYVGQRVVGTTSGIVPGTGDSGKILENHFSGYMGRGMLILVDIVGSTHLVEPYFHDNEGLSVNGVEIANADGHTMNGGIGTIIYPDTYIRNCLGGDNWAKVTGIEPYRLLNVGSWDGALPATEFLFTTTQTKLSAIEEIAEYCSFVFLIKWRDIGGGIYRPCAYFVPEEDIDEAAPYGLDLPAAVTIDISAASGATVVDINLDRKGEEKYNHVTVRCQSMAGGIWYESLVLSPGCISGDEIPIHYYEENKNIATQADCDARALDIYNYYSNHVETWTVNLKKRSDLQLLQKIAFVGFGTDYQLPDANYRIISVAHEYSATTNDTKIQVVADADFTAHLRLSRVFTGPIATMQAVAKDGLNKLAKNKAGIAISVVDGVISFQDDRGNVQLIRDSS
jgi:hypothetical protein